MQHVDVWRGLDRLAEKHGLTASGLARLAGLDSTAFNKSKRLSKDGRPRWPSTESISRALEAVGEEFEGFVDLMTGTRGIKMPVLDLEQAARPGNFDAEGTPKGLSWEDVRFPGQGFNHAAFALDIVDSSLEPTYRLGDRLIISSTAEVHSGDRVLVMTKSEQLIAGELGRRTLRRVELKPLSEIVSPRVFTPSELTWIARILWVSQ